MSWKRLTISSALLLAACAQHQPAPPPPKPVTITKYVTADCGAPPQRSTIELRQVTWAVIETLEGDESRQWFALAPSEYADLGWNTSEMIKGARELRGEATYYSECLKRHRAAAAKMNAEQKP